jgi:hypothetical protein
MCLVSDMQLQCLYDQTYISSLASSDNLDFQYVWLRYVIWSNEIRHLSIVIHSSKWLKDSCMSQSVLWSKVMNHVTWDTAFHTKDNMPWCVWNSCRHKASRPWNVIIYQTAGPSRWSKSKYQNNSDLWAKQLSSRVNYQWYHTILCIHKIFDKTPL